MGIGFVLQFIFAIIYSKSRYFFPEETQILTDRKVWIIYGWFLPEHWSTLKMLTSTFICIYLLDIHSESLSEGQWFSKPLSIILFFNINWLETSQLDPSGL